MNKVWIALPISALALSACVTINIYFPAAAAEKAADKIIEEVWQSEQAKKSATPTVAPATTAPATTTPEVKETK